MTNAVIDLLTSHQSIRNYLDKPLTKEQVEAIENAVMQTSSSCFFQMVTTIKVTDKQMLAKIAKLSGDQHNIETCAQFWVFCIDARRFLKTNLLTTPIPFRLFYSGLNDVSLSCQQALVAAESMGLGCVVIGGHKAGIDELSQMLNLKEGVIPALALCIGVVDEEYKEDQLKPRLPKQCLFMDNTYNDDAFNQAVLDEYNQKMRDYYMSRKHGKRDDNWTNSCVQMLPPLNSPKIKNALINYIEKKGFSISF